MSDSKIQSSKVSLEPILWVYSANEAGLHPVKLRVTHRRKPKYYSVADADGQKLFISKDEWQAAMGERPRGKPKEIRERIDLVAGQARAAIKTSSNNRPFTFDSFEKNFLLGGATKTFYTIYEEHLQTLRKEGRIGTEISYRNAFNKLKKFSPRDFMPIDLTAEKLRDFEIWMRSEDQDLSVTTIGIYTRALRVMYNVCIEQDSSLKELYPFAKGRQERSKYKIKTGQGSKGDALTADQLKKFTKIKTEPETAAHEAKLYWMFSFYAQGMNTNDIFRLKYKDVGWDAIRYERSKTERTESKQEIIEIPMTQAIKKIILELGGNNKAPDAFVFPLLPKKCSAELAKKLIHQKNKTINKALAKICKDKLPSITMYWSRHTYASLLKNAGIPLEQIRELLGHGDLKTTEHYLRRFDLDSKRVANESIMKKLA